MAVTAMLMFGRHKFSILTEPAGFLISLHETQTAKLIRSDFEDYTNTNAMQFSVMMYIHCSLCIVSDGMFRLYQEIG